MALRGRITVTSGPDRGKSFDLADEVVRIGKGDGNQIVLSDTTASDFHLNILQREGRFAVLTQAAEGVTVEGNVVPPDRWVWLPNSALIQLTRRTALEFQCEQSSDSVSVQPTSDPAPEAAPTSLPLSPQAATTTTTTAVLPKPRRVPAPVPSPTAETATAIPRSPTDSTSSGDKLPRRKSGAGDKAERKTVTARFITDGPGDPLVKLGEDGHLPELQLEDGRKRAGPQQEAKKTSPVWLILILSMGFGMSMLMLFIDFEGLGGSAHQKAEARQKLVSYYADVKETPLKPYQIYLRQAQRARSRRDFATERAEYRKVLQLLRAEGKNAYTGVTGTEEKDKELENLMGILLRD